MNRFDLIRQMSDKQIAQFLCYLHNDCNKCVNTHHCWENHNGWFDRLSKDVTNMDRGAVGLPAIDIERGKL